MLASPAGSSTGDNHLEQMEPFRKITGSLHIACLDFKRPARKGLVEAVQSMLGNSCNAESEASRTDHRPQVGSVYHQERCEIWK